MNWLIGIGATALIAGGILLTFPGAVGRRIAGFIMTWVGLTAALQLIGRSK